MAQREPGKQTQNSDVLPRNEAHGSLEDGRMHNWRLVNFECGLTPLSPKVKFLLSQINCREVLQCVRRIFFAVKKG